MEELEKEIQTLKAENENLKCCGNCKHHLVDCPKAVMVTNGILICDEWGFNNGLTKQEREV